MASALPAGLLADRFDKALPKATTATECSLNQNQGALLIRRQGEDWRAPQVHAYRDEEMLKLMLRESPQLLAMCPKGSVFVDELTVPNVGSVDLVGVAPGGEITLIECKLESNPQIRREIIGQIFAYSAGLWKMTYEEFDRHFSDRHRGARLPVRFAARCRRLKNPLGGKRPFGKLWQRI